MNTPHRERFATPRSALCPNQHGAEDPGDAADEPTERNRIEQGRTGPVASSHNDLHQVTNRTGTDAARYTWDVNGNLKTRTGGLYGDATLTHDWRDKLTSVQQGTTLTGILLDPLGRMVGKVKHTPDGDLARAYLHDGDQAVLEYVQAAGSTTWQPERRHIWTRWIDDLAVEQVDTDGDGSLETTLYPITDLLGSVQLLTDDAGTIVQRITNDPDGTPHFCSKDRTQPSVTRIAWTGDGTLPTGDTVEPQAFEIGLSEPIDPASAANATATLTPDGGDPQTLTLTLAADSRTAHLTGAPSPPARGTPSTSTASPTPATTPSGPRTPPSPWPTPTPTRSSTTPRPRSSSPSSTARTPSTSSSTSW